MKFYYSWKKTRSRTSVIDRQEKKKNEGGSENGSVNGSHDDSDVEDKVSALLMLLSCKMIVNDDSKKMNFASINARLRH